MSELRAVFENIMALNRWSGDESQSGPGSTLNYTQRLRPHLETFLRDFKIASLFDAPCGDFNWMKAVKFPEGFAYVGGDIASSLIEKNRIAYASEGREFVEFDIVSGVFPEADVWFCRDCLFHLPEAYIVKALQNFCDSKIRFLMMTNHVNASGFKNMDIPAGEFRLVDFFGAPFDLPEAVLFRVEDYIDPFPQREMCVWTREQVAAAMKKPRR
jgi:hypothetical protein